MKTFVSENLSTIIIGAVVLGLVAFALVRTILNLRKGRSACGCGCGCGGCAKAEPRAKSR
ncbi:MAG: FeoB-associated Cys-rich membrane protein [Spirochaetaceae bacterium]|jgi:hypothetical protein|nr:FeoB-associated Cys-rich membrane protein [Spirochaetaceae bacterium]